MVQQRNVRKRGGDIADGQVDTADLADDAVEAAKILAAAVGTAELGTDAVDADAILAGAVGHSEIQDDDVRPTEFSDDIQRNRHVGTVETGITGALATVDYCIEHPRAEADLAQTSEPSGGTVFYAYPDANGAGSADFILFGS